jgi:UMP-CMP kinase
MGDLVQVNHMLFMNTSEEIMLERLLHRSKTSGRVDDKEDVIKARFQTYMDSTLPIIKKFEEEGKVIEIDASKTVDEVFTEIEERLILKESS